MAVGTGYVVFTATDDNSGIIDFQGGCWSVQSTTGPTTFGVCGFITSIGNNQYKIPFTIGQYAVNGSYYLDTFYFSDKAGNSTPYYEANQDKTFFLNTSIPVPRMTVTGAM
jgi:hypothetical protein